MSEHQSQSRQTYEYMASLAHRVIITKDIDMIAWSAQKERGRRKIVFYGQLSCT